MERRQERSLVFRGRYLTSYFQSRGCWEGCEKSEKGGTRWKKKKDIHLQAISLIKYRILLWNTAHGSAHSALRDWFENFFTTFRSQFPKSVADIETLRIEWKSKLKNGINFDYAELILVCHLMKKIYKKMCYQKLNKTI